MCAGRLKIAVGLFFSVSLLENSTCFADEYYVDREWFESTFRQAMDEFARKRGFSNFADQTEKRAAAVKEFSVFTENFEKINALEKARAEGLEIAKFQDPKGFVEALESRLSAIDRIQTQKTLCRKKEDEINSAPYSIDEDFLKNFDSFGRDSMLSTKSGSGIDEYSQDGIAVRRGSIVSWEGRYLHERPRGLPSQPLSRNASASYDWVQKIETNNGREELKKKAIAIREKQSAPLALLKPADSYNLPYLENIFKRETENELYAPIETFRIRFSDPEFNRAKSLFKSIYSSDEDLVRGSALATVLISRGVFSADLVRAAEMYEIKDETKDQIRYRLLLGSFRRLPYYLRFSVIRELEAKSPKSKFLEIGSKANQQDFSDETPENLLAQSKIALENGEVADFEKILTPLGNQEENDNRSLRSEGFRLALGEFTRKPSIESFRAMAAVAQSPQQRLTVIKNARFLLAHQIVEIPLSFFEKIENDFSHFVDARENLQKVFTPSEPEDQFLRQLDAVRSDEAPSIVDAAVRIHRDLIGDKLYGTQSEGHEKIRDAEGALKKFKDSVSSAIADAVELTERSTLSDFEKSKIILRLSITNLRLDGGLDSVAKYLSRIHPTELTETQAKQLLDLMGYAIDEMVEKINAPHRLAVELGAELHRYDTETWIQQSSPPQELVDQKNILISATVEAKLAHRSDLSNLEFALRSVRDRILSALKDSPARYLNAMDLKTSIEQSPNGRGE